MVTGQRWSASKGWSPVRTTTADTPPRPDARWSTDDRAGGVLLVFGDDLGMRSMSCTVAQSLLVGVVLAFAYIVIDVWRSDKAARQVLAKQEDPLEDE